MATVILPGNYPDPSIVCVDNEYYVVNSTGLDVPGLPVWHSSDLKSWNRISYALTNKVGDVWAPDFVYFKGKYYIYFTALIERGMGNYVVTAEKPEGPWSDPVRLNLFGIDPGHIATPDGERYIYMNGGQIAQLDETGMKVMGQQKNTFDGWPIPEDYVIECFCLEGPKAVYHNGYYYLIAAQGGTTGPSTSHMAVAARSENVNGPWELSPYNPIIHTEDKSERWWSAGHGTLFMGAGEKWYMIFHSYENSYYTLGRQVLITPIEWTEDGWFKEASETSFHDNTGKDFTDEFNGETLDLHWAFINDSPAARINLKDGKLLLHANGDRSDSSNPMLITAENKRYQISTEVSITDSVTAGLVLYYNNEAHWGMAFSRQGIFQIVKGQYSRPVRMEKQPLTFHLKILNDRNDISYYYSYDGDEWIKLESSHEISGFNANTLGGFRSIRPGIFAAGKGNATFEYFKYEAIEMPE